MLKLISDDLWSGFYDIDYKSDKMDVAENITFTFDNVIKLLSIDDVIIPRLSRIDVLRDRIYKSICSDDYSYSVSVINYGMIVYWKFMEWNCLDHTIDIKGFKFDYYGDLNLNKIYETDKSEIISDKLISYFKKNIETVSGSYLYLISSTNNEQVFNKKPWIGLKKR